MRLHNMFALFLQHHLWFAWSAQLLIEMIVIVFCWRFCAELIAKRWSGLLTAVVFFGLIALGVFNACRGGR